MRITLHLEPEPGTDAKALLDEMMADMKSDPKHRLTLETRNWIVDVKPARPARPRPERIHGYVTVNDILCRPVRWMHEKLDDAGHALRDGDEPDVFRALDDIDFAKSQLAHAVGLLEMLGREQGLP